MRCYFVLVFLLLFTGLFLLDESRDFSFDRSWTTAVCEGSVCRDFLVYCKDGGLVDMEPLTGSVVFEDDWEDPRKNKELC